MRQLNVDWSVLPVFCFTLMFSTLQLTHCSCTWAPLYSTLNTVLVWDFFVSRKLLSLFPSSSGLISLVELILETARNAPFQFIVAWACSMGASHRQLRWFSAVLWNIWYIFRPHLPVAYTCFVRIYSKTYLGKKRAAVVTWVQWACNFGSPCEVSKYTRYRLTKVVFT